MSFGVNLQSPVEIAHFARENMPDIPFVCVSMGAGGAVLVTKDGFYHAQAPKIKIKALQGAGDAMVAGLVLGLCRHVSAGDMLQYGTAAAAATTALPGTEMGSLSIFTKLVDKLPEGLYTPFA